MWYDSAIYDLKCIVWIMKVVWSLKVYFMVKKLWKFVSSSIFKHVHIYNRFHSITLVRMVVELKENGSELILECLIIS